MLIYRFCLHVNQHTSENKRFKVNECASVLGTRKDNDILR